MTTIQTALAQILDEFKFYKEESGSYCTAAEHVPRLARALERAMRFMDNFDDSYDDELGRMDGGLTTEFARADIG